MGDTEWQYLNVKTGHRNQQVGGGSLRPIWADDLGVTPTAGQVPADGKSCTEQGSVTFT